MTTGPAVPRELLDPVIAYFNPRRVILFGSQARGDAGPDSDIDLLVVVDDDTPAEKVTLRAGFDSRRGYHHPADIFPVREEAFRRLCGIPGTLPRAAVVDGITVYEKVPAFMSDPRPEDIRKSIQRWDQGRARGYPGGAHVPGCGAAAARGGCRPHPAGSGESTQGFPGSRRR